VAPPFDVPERLIAIQRLIGFVDTGKGLSAVDISANWHGAVRDKCRFPAERRAHWGLKQTRCCLRLTLGSVAHDDIEHALLSRLETGHSQKAVAYGVNVDSSAQGAL